MTERIKKLNELHDRALAAAEKHNFHGTAMLAPGTGKTIFSFRVAYRMLELGLMQKGDTIVYNAETVTREKVLFNEDSENLGEVHKFKKLYGKDILRDFDFRFHCYQAKPDQIYNNFENVGLVINDEGQDMLTETRYTVLTKSKCPYNIVLTGAMGMELNVFPSRIPADTSGRVSQSQAATDNKQITDYITKGQMLQAFAPIFIEYTTAEAIRDGVVAEFKSYVIKHKLDDTTKNQLIWKSKDKWGTEQQFWDQKYDFAAGPGSWTKPAYVTKAILHNSLPNLLYSAPSKDIVVQAILKRLEGQKTLVFGQRINTLQRILGKDKVITSKNESKLTDQFNKGEILVIGSSKLLQQGSNLNGVQNIIFHSYDSHYYLWQQRRARVRWLEGDQAKLFFIVTTDTFEDDRKKYRNVKRVKDGKEVIEVKEVIQKGWYSKMKEERDEKGKLINIHDFNVVATINSSTLVNWYKNQLNESS